MTLAAHLRTVEQPPEPLRLIVYRSYQHANPDATHPGPFTYDNPDAYVVAGWNNAGDVLIVQADGTRCTLAELLDRIHGREWSDYVDTVDAYVVRPLQLHPIRPQEVTA